MTPQELMDLATKAADDSNRVVDQQVNDHITASERIYARGVSEAISKTAIELIRNPTS